MLIGAQMSQPPWNQKNEHKQNVQIRTLSHEIPKTVTSLAENYVFTSDHIDPSEKLIEKIGFQGL